MEMVHRFGSGKDEEYFESYFELLKEYPNAGNAVWFASHYGFPPVEKHEEEAARLNKIAEKFRKNGIAVSIQISNTIGHGEYMSSRDCTGLVYEDSPAENMVGPDGTKANYCFCWNGRHFREYTKKAVAAYARLHPDCVWFDDDIRPNNHAPVDFGCFCDNCIATFNKEYSSASPFTREELVNEILYGDLAVRERWVRFVREGLYSFTKEICTAFHEVSPESEFGYQYGAYGAYSGHDFSYIFNAMKEAGGKAPRSRPGGGAYDDHDLNEFLSKAVFMNRANCMLPEYVREICPEIENLPFECFAKSAAGCAFECAYYMANGATDMSFSMMMHENEVREYYEETLSRLSADATYRNRLAAVNRETRAGGAMFFISEEMWKRKLNKEAGEGFAALNNEKSGSLDLWIRDAIPMTFEKTAGGVIILYPEAARDITERDFAELLRSNVFTDGETLEILREKFGEKVCESVGLTATEICETDRGKFEEHNFPHATLPRDFRKWQNNFFTRGRSKVYYMSLYPKKTKSVVQALAAYETQLNIAPYENGQYPYGISAAISQTEEDGRWAVFGNAIWKGIMSFYRREQLLNMMDELCARSGGLCARLKSPKQAALLPRKDSAGRTACVSVANLTIGESGESILAVRNPRGERFTFMRQGSAEEIVLNAESARTENGICEYIVKLPSIAPYSVSTVFIS